MEQKRKYVVWAGSEKQKVCMEFKRLWKMGYPTEELLERVQYPLEPHRRRRLNMGQMNVLLQEYQDLDPRPRPVPVTPPPTAEAAPASLPATSTPNRAEDFLRPQEIEDLKEATRLLKGIVESMPALIGRQLDTLFPSGGLLSAEVIKEPIPTILVVGPLPSQGNVLAHAFHGLAHIVIWEQGEGKTLRSKAAGANKVILMTDKISHVMQDVVLSGAKKEDVVFCAGGVTSLIEAIKPLV